MKGLIVSMILFLAALTAGAQYASPQVLATSGGTGGSSSTTLQWTLGEPVIFALQGESSVLTCGFHQTDSFCFGDFNFDGQINTVDVLILLGDWACSGICLTDMDENGEVGTTDILLLLGTFGTLCNIEF